MKASPPPFLFLPGKGIAIPAKNLPSKEMALHPALGPGQTFPKCSYQPVTEVVARSPSYLASFSECWMN